MAQQQLDDQAYSCAGLDLGGGGIMGLLWLDVLERIWLRSSTT
jgi:hypothetical protein